MTIPTSPVEPVVVTAPGIAVELVPFGAAVRRLLVTDAGGRTVDVVLGHRDASAYDGRGGYLGAIVGRLANRLGGAGFDLDGRHHDVTANEGTTSLHGGLEGFDRRRWDVVSRTGSSVTFALDSPDGDQGYPGHVHVEVTYTVADGSVSIDYVATTDKTTVVNLTNHAYFNLTGEASGPVDEHRLTVPASRYTPVGPDLLPTGELADVTGTPFDLRAATRLGDALAQGGDQLRYGGGIDHNLVVDGEGLREVARLEAPSAPTLVVESDQPGLQVYTGAHFDDTVVGVGGSTYGPRAGIALETQDFPDAPHHDAFPSVVLRPGETYRTTTVWRFS